MNGNLQKTALDYAQKLVRIESVTYHERECADALAQLLSDLDFQVRIDDGNDVIARLPGRQPGAPTLMFMGHHDTVDLGDLSEWDFPPLDAVVENGKLHGRGSNDEKGGLAGFLAAVHWLQTRAAESRPASTNVCEHDTEGNSEAVRTCGTEGGSASESERSWRPLGDLILVSTREEIADIENRGIVRVLKSGIQADACVCLEPTEVRIMLGHRGRAVTDFRVRGSAAHASMPGRGVNAVAAAARLIGALDQMPLPGVRADWSGTQAVTKISGGTKENIIPEECTFTVDRRILEGEDEKTLSKEYQQVLDRMTAEDATFRASFSIRPPYYAALTDAADPFVGTVSSIFSDLGLPAEPEVFPGHTDAEWIINDLKIPCVIIGPGSLSTAHTSHEYVPVEDLGRVAEIYSLIIERFWQR